jgi:hypothetical protein
MVREDQGIARQVESMMWVFVCLRMENKVIQMSKRSRLRSVVI